MQPALRHKRALPVELNPAQQRPHTEQQTAIVGAYHCDPLATCIAAGANEKSFFAQRGLFRRCGEDLLLESSGCSTRRQVNDDGRRSRIFAVSRSNRPAKPAPLLSLLHKNLGSLVGPVAGRRAENDAAAAQVYHAAALPHSQSGTHHRR